MLNKNTSRIKVQGQSEAALQIGSYVAIACTLISAEAVEPRSYFTKDDIQSFIAYFHKYV